LAQITGALQITHSSCTYAENLHLVFAIPHPGALEGWYSNNSPKLRYGTERFGANLMDSVSYSVTEGNSTGDIFAARFSFGDCLRV
jgi:hypothetical protein